MKSASARTVMLLLLSVILAALSGCVTRPLTPESPHLEHITQLTDHQRQLDNIERWQLKGRLAINYNGDSWNASIHWQKRGEQYDIQLYLPMGQGSMQLHGDTDGAILKTSDGEQFEAVSAEDIFYQQFKLTFPISALHDWVIGRPSTAIHSSHDWLQGVDKSGKMVTLKQDHWDLRLFGYRAVSAESSGVTPDKRHDFSPSRDFSNFTAPKGLSLPRKIFLSQNGNSVRMVIQQWQLND